MRSHEQPDLRDVEADERCLRSASSVACITAGNAAFGPNETGNLDLVAMDDFIFAEPVSAAVLPEPSSLSLLLLPLLSLALTRRRAGCRTGRLAG